MLLVVGALMAACATVMSNYGSFLQKRELGNLPRIGSESWNETIRAFAGNIDWLKGQGIQIAGAMTHNVAIGLAPLSVVEPINAAGICLLVILAVTKLNEKASPVDWAGICSIIAGVIMLGITLIKTPTVSHAYRPVILWFFIILMLLVSISSLAAAFIRKDERASSLIGIGVGMMVGLMGILTKLTWVDIANRWAEYRIAGVLYSSYFWIAVVLTVITMVLFQTALQRGSAIVVVPLVTGFSNMIPIIVGLIAFREPFPSGAFMASLRLASILLIIGGAILLALRKEGGGSIKKVYSEKGTRTVYE